MLKVVRTRFMPQRVLIHMNPAAPPPGFAKVIGTPLSLVDEVTAGEEGVSIRLNVRVSRLHVWATYLRAERAGQRVGYVRVWVLIGFFATSDSRCVYMSRLVSPRLLPCE